MVGKDLTQTIEDTKELILYLEDGCKPIQACKIGTEHEKFGYDKTNLKPLPYSGVCSIESILEGLRQTFGWSPILEDDKMIGLSKAGANISLEPGGQLELSGALLDNVHQTCLEVANHLAEVKTIADRIGAGFIGLGAAPIWKDTDMPIMPKGRYKLMAPYMEKVGSHGTKMMFRTCTVQVNLDYCSEADMIRKLRVGLALQPIATALFSASPFFEGKKTGYNSFRSRIWQKTDKTRTGMLPFVFEKGFGFEAWVDYALDVPMYFVYRNGKYLNALGQSFRDFLKGELKALPNEKPIISDWEDHLTTIFPEVRLKKFIEMRGADAGPWAKICALPAFWVGIIYNQISLEGAWDLCKDWTCADRNQLYHDVAKLGLEASIRNRQVKDIAFDLLNLSHQGLLKRGKRNIHETKTDETEFLQPLFEILENGSSLADEMLDKYSTIWSGDLKCIYSEYCY